MLFFKNITNHVILINLKYAIITCSKLAQVYLKRKWLYCSVINQQIRIYSIVIREREREKTPHKTCFHPWTHLAAIIRPIQSSSQAPGCASLRHFDKMNDQQSSAFWRHEWRALQIRIDSFKQHLANASCTLNTNLRNFSCLHVSIEKNSYGNFDVFYDPNLFIVLFEREREKMNSTKTAMQTNRGDERWR